MYLYLILFLSFLLLWIIGMYFWLKSDDRNKFLGLLLIGPLVFLEKDINRDLTKREKYGWLAVIALMIFAVLFSGR